MRFVFGEDFCRKPKTVKLPVKSSALVSSLICCRKGKIVQSFLNNDAGILSYMIEKDNLPTVLGLPGT